MVNKDSNEGGGFARYRQKSGTILLPLATIAAIKAEAAIALEAANIAALEEAETEKQAAIKVAAFKAKAPVVPVVKPPSIKPGPRDVEIFKHAAVEELLDNQWRMDTTQKQAGEKITEKLANGGSRWRTIPSVKPADILALRAQFENMAEPIAQLAAEIELMSHLPAADFQITPILLLGAPGIGKTAFAMALAKTMGLPFKKLNGTEPSFALTGSHPTWSKAAPGMMLEQLAVHSCAAPLFLVDEIDKPSGERYPIVSALLALLEPENATEFKDEFFQVNFNARHALWILTANTTTGVSDPLLSRMAVFDIPPPGIAQRKRIITAEFKKLCDRTGLNVKTTGGDIAFLAERLDLDLRKVRRIVRDSFIAAIGQDQLLATIELPHRQKWELFDQAGAKNASFH
jgi:ATP-dependent Lon protease